MGESDRDPGPTGHADEDRLTRSAIELDPVNAIVEGEAELAGTGRRGLKDLALAHGGHEHTVDSLTLRVDDPAKDLLG